MTIQRKGIITMKNLVKTFIMSIAMVAAVTFSTVSAEAKEYKAQRNSNLYGMCLESTPNSENTVKNGVMNVVNADELSIYAKNDKIMYYEKANGTDVSKVKTPTTKSKHHEWGKSIKITKDTVIKFKVVKQKTLYKKDGSFKKYAPITAAQLKKAKTYYVVIKVKKVNPFKQTKENVYLDKSKKLTVDIKSLDPATFDELTYTTDGSNPTLKSRSLYTYNPTITVNKNCTIKVAAFKLGKKVGTKTYTVTLKKYTNKVTNPYRLPERSYIFEVPTASTDKELEMEVSCKGVDLTKGDRNLPKDGTVKQSIVTVKQYQKVYYKENGKLVQCDRKLYSTETKKYNVPCFNAEQHKGTTDKCYAGFCKTEEEFPGITGMRITYVNTDGYLVTELVAPGERMKGEMMYGAYFEFQVNGEWEFTTDRARCKDFARDDSDHWGVDNFMRTLKGEKIKLY